MASSQNRPVDEISEAEAREELERLAAEIAEHDARYYRDDAPTVSDAEYDALRRRNSQIEARYPSLIREDSPSTRVGAEVSEKFGKIRHALPMLSLDNAFSDEDVADFARRVRRFLKLADDAPLVQGSYAEVSAGTPALNPDDLRLEIKYNNECLWWMPGQTPDAMHRACTCRPERAGTNRSRRRTTARCTSIRSA